MPPKHHCCATGEVRKAVYAHGGLSLALPGLDAAANDQSSEDLLLVTRQGICTSEHGRLYLCATTAVVIIIDAL